MGRSPPAMIVVGKGVVQLNRASHQTNHSASHLNPAQYQPPGKQGGQWKTDEFFERLGSYFKEDKAKQLLMPH